MPGEETPEVGDQVSWAYGNGRPSGEVAEKKTEGEVTIQSKKGNTIKRKADPENPALHITRPGNDVVKRQSEVQVEEKNEAADDASEQEEVENADGANGEEEEEKVEVKKGGKRARETDAEEEVEKEPKKARGRPKKAAAAPAKATASAAATPAKKGKVGAPKKAEKPEKPAKAEKAEKKVAKTDAGPEGEKKGRGRPKKDGSSGPPAPKYQKKTKGPSSTNGVGSRTRSKN